MIKSITKFKGGKFMLVWDFELNMCKEEYCSENICIDEFGSAIFSVSNPDIDIDSDDWICFGADYNFCKESGIDSSAMYLYVINNTICILCHNPTIVKPMKRRFFKKSAE